LFKNQSKFGEDIDKSYLAHFSMAHGAK